MPTKPGRPKAWGVGLGLAKGAGVGLAKGVGVGLHLVATHASCTMSQCCALRPGALLSLSVSVCLSFSLVLSLSLSLGCPIRTCLGARVAHARATAQLDRSFFECFALRGDMPCLVGCDFFVCFAWRSCRAL